MGAGGRFVGAGSGCEYLTNATMVNTARQWMWLRVVGVWVSVSTSATLGNTVRAVGVGARGGC